MQSSDSFHIVVTDINHNVRDFLQRELEKEGYAVACVKTGPVAYERIFSAFPLELIILDPELFYDFDQLFIEKIIHRRPLLQIIIHTYADAIPLMQPSLSIHLVEKNGQSIGSIKSVIHQCFTQFHENGPSLKPLTRNPSTPL